MFWSWILLENNQYRFDTAQTHALGDKSTSTYRNLGQYSVTWVKVFPELY